MAFKLLDYTNNYMYDKCVPFVLIDINIKYKIKKLKYKAYIYVSPLNK